MHIDGPVIIGENLEGCMSMLYFFQIIDGNSAFDTLIWKNEQKYNL
jgi:hypothetical protein